MAWIRPRYWRILEKWGTEQALPQSVEPYAYGQRRSQLDEWIVKARKNQIPYLIAAYGAKEEGRPDPMRVFGLFLYPLTTLSKETRQVPLTEVELLEIHLEASEQKENTKDGN